MLFKYINLQNLVLYYDMAAINCGFKSRISIYSGYQLHFIVSFARCISNMFQFNNSGNLFPKSLLHFINRLIALIDISIVIFGSKKLSYLTGTRYFTVLQNYIINFLEVMCAENQIVFYLYGKLQNRLLTEFQPSGRKVLQEVEWNERIV